MVRLHYSRGIRRAELARSREPTIQRPIVAGDTVYFWRVQKVNRRGDSRLSTSSRRRRLELRRWHGPAIVLALERSSEASAVTNVFLSFKGQVTKCALEHVRLASSLEQLSAGAWEAAIKELTEGGGTPVRALVPGGLEDVPEEPVGDLVSSAEPPSTAAPGTPVGQLLQRPVVQRALQRAQNQPLQLTLGSQALARGQPGGFAVELRSLMERGRKRSVTESAEPTESLADSFSRRVSSVGPAGVADPPRLSSEPQGEVVSGDGAADPHRLSSEPQGEVVSTVGGGSFSIRGPYREPRPATSACFTWWGPTSSTASSGPS